MTASSLPATPRAGAEGLYALQAATGLIIVHGTGLDRDDFGSFICHGAGTAAIDWEAAISALGCGALMGCMNVSASGSGGLCPPGVGVPAEVAGRTGA